MDWLMWATVVTNHYSQLATCYYYNYWYKLYWLYYRLLDDSSAWVVVYKSCNKHSITKCVCRSIAITIVYSSSFICLQNLILCSWSCGTLSVIPVTMLVGNIMYLPVHISDFVDPTSSCGITSCLPPKLCTYSTSLVCCTIEHYN